MHLCCYWERYRDSEEYQLERNGELTEFRVGEKGEWIIFSLVQKTHEETGELEDRTDTKPPAPAKKRVRFEDLDGAGKGKCVVCRKAGV